MMRRFRQFPQIGGANPRPYDAAVEYIVLDGTQRFDTDDIASIKTVFEFDVSHDYDGNNISRFLVDGTVITGSGYRYRMIVRDFYYAIYAECVILLSSNNKVITSGRHKISVNNDSFFSVDGEPVGSPVRESRVTTDKFRLFNGVSGNNGFTGMVYEVTMKDIDGNVIHHWIPVRNGPVGFLFDTVSNEPLVSTIGNAVIAGPDKVG